MNYKYRDSYSSSPIASHWVAALLLCMCITQNLHDLTWCILRFCAVYIVTFHLNCGSFLPLCLWTFLSLSYILSVFPLCTEHLFNVLPHFSWLSFSFSLFFGFYHLCPSILNFLTFSLVTFNLVLTFLF
jgi:hypothetical protein